MESKDKRLEYLKEYNKEKRIRISLNLSKEYDPDIIEAIEREGKGNKQAGVKSLIRKGIEYNKDRQRPVIC
jgi:hypothetical protein